MLDEPTSGLDAAAAAFVMRFLKQTAQRLRVCMFCTIHQPSSSVFASFDSVCFLTSGRVAYLGKAASLADYLESVGRPAGAGTNPADFMLDLINRDLSLLFRGGKDRFLHTVTRDFPAKGKNFIGGFDKVKFLFRFSAKCG